MTARDDGPEHSEYIQQSVIPMFHFEKSLPRLPIPKLEDTCARYLTALKPLVSVEQLTATRDIVESFRDGAGKALHQQLVDKDKANRHTSYISEAWYNMYLGGRIPILLNHNPFMLFSDPQPIHTNQVVRTAVLLRSALRMMKSLQAEVLEPDIFYLKPENETPFLKRVLSLTPSSLSWYAAYAASAFPLDMSQYGRLFCTTRIPRPVKDELVTDSKARHIAVLRNGHYYVFDVISTDGRIASTSEIYQQLSEIASDTSPAAEHPVAILTSEDRDTWAVARDELAVFNADVLKLIDSSIFLVCLDNDDPSTPESLAHSLLHGDGSNRWLDKSFSLIVNKGGKAAINFEHSWGDGICILRFMNEVHDDNMKSTWTPDKDYERVKTMSPVNKLKFNLDVNNIRAIEIAQEKFQKAVDLLTFHPLVYRTYGRDFIKSRNLAPDAIMQLSFQMAFYDQYGFSPSTYESCSTGAFKHGRTETVRSASSETAEFAKAFVQENKPSRDDLQKLLQSVSAKHNKLTREAALGQGFDRHLFALRHLAAAKGESHAIFEDKSYGLMNHIILSTSTLPQNRAIQFGAFAPVTPNGFGVGYRVNPDHLGCVVSAYPTRDGSAFVTRIERSLDFIHDALK